MRMMTSTAIVNAASDNIRVSLSVCDGKLEQTTHTDRATRMQEKFPLAGTYLLVVR
jgi:hypothetical protein